MCRKPASEENVGSPVIPRAAHCRPGERRPAMGSFAADESCSWWRCAPIRRYRATRFRGTGILFSTKNQNNTQSRACPVTPYRMLFATRPDTRRLRARTCTTPAGARPWPTDVAGTVSRPPLPWPHGNGMTATAGVRSEADFTRRLARATCDGDTVRRRVLIAPPTTHIVIAINCNHPGSDVGDSIGRKT